MLDMMQESECAAALDGAEWMGLEVDAVFEAAHATCDEAEVCGAVVDDFLHSMEQCLDDLAHGVGLGFSGAFDDSIVPSPSPSPDAMPSPSPSPSPSPDGEATPSFAPLMCPASCASAFALLADDDEACAPLDATIGALGFDAFDFLAAACEESASCVGWGEQIAAITPGCVGGLITLDDIGDILDPAAICTPACKVLAMTIDTALEDCAFTDLSLTSLGLPGGPGVEAAWLARCTAEELDTEATLLAQCQSELPPLAAKVQECFDAVRAGRGELHDARLARRADPRVRARLGGGADVHQRAQERGGALLGRVHRTRGRDGGGVRGRPVGMLVRVL
jgi:hypothetical protein